MSTDSPDETLFDTDAIDAELYGRGGILKDTYGLPRVAFHLARVIERLGFAGQTIALNAPWGGGKSSLVHLLRLLYETPGTKKNLDDKILLESEFSELEESKFRPPRYSRAAFKKNLQSWRSLNVRVIEFNAWLEGGEGAIAVSLLDAISDALSEETANEFGMWLKRCGRSLVRNKSAFIRNATLTFNVVSAVHKPTEQVSGATVSDGTPSPDIMLEKIVRRLEDNKEAADRVRIIVVIDDIDRIPPDRLHTLMAAFWWFRKLPGVTFLLLFDQEQVLGSLARTIFKSTGGEEADRASAANYLEKIVQYAFTLPQPTSDQLLSAFKNLLINYKDTSIKDGISVAGSGGHFGEHLRWNAVCEYVLKPLVTTPRSVKRLFWTVRLSWPMRNYIHIDIRDLIAVEAVRLFRPDIFKDAQTLARNTQLGLHQPSSWSFSEKENENILAVLFPAQHLSKATGQAIEDIASVRARGGLSDARKMDQYLSGMPRGSVDVTYNVELFFTGSEIGWLNEMEAAREGGELEDLCAYVVDRITAEPSEDARTHDDFMRLIQLAGEQAEGEAANEYRRLASIYG